MTTTNRKTILAEALEQMRDAAQYAVEANVKAKQLAQYATEAEKFANNANLEAELAAEKYAIAIGGADDLTTATYANGVKQAADNAAEWLDKIFRLPRQKRR